MTEEEFHIFVTKALAVLQRQISDQASAVNKLDSRLQILEPMTPEGEFVVRLASGKLGLYIAAEPTEEV